MWVNSSQSARRRWLIAALAVFVFALALRAKLSLYDPPQPGTVQVAAAAKLWVNGDKPRLPFTGLLPVLLLTAVFRCLVPARLALGSLPVSPRAARQRQPFELFRFLRPPPAL